MLTTLAAILITWYATKVYYTRSFVIETNTLEKRGFIEAQCSKCARFIVLKQENLRTPFYCSSCR